MRGAIVVVLAVGIVVYGCSSPSPQSPAQGRAQTRALPTIVNGGTAYGCAGSPDGNNVTLSQQMNGQPFNTAGADLIIKAHTGSNSVPENTIIQSDALSGVATGNVWTAVFPGGVNDNQYARQQVLTTHPVATGANASFTLNAAGAPILCVIALQTGSADFGWRLAQQASRVVAGTSINLMPALTIPEPNAFMLTVVSSLDNLGSGPAGFSPPLGMNLIGGLSFGQFMAWKFNPGPMESAPWTFPVGSSNKTLTAVVFVPDVPLTPPAMTFVQQPTSTAMGMTMNPPIHVTLSTAASDTLVLSVDSGSCTLSGTLQQQATASGAMWPGLVAQTPGLGCVVRVHNVSNSAMPDILSNPFDIPYPPSTGTVPRVIGGGIL